MKKIISIISFLLLIQLGSYVYGTDTNETIKEQEKALGISDFLEEAEKYTEETFTDIDLGNIYNSAISGEIDTNGLLSAVLSLVGEEVLNTITTLRICFSYYSCS